jgi:hypothetical protein
VHSAVKDAGPHVVNEDIIHGELDASSLTSHGALHELLRTVRLVHLAL